LRKYNPQLKTKHGHLELLLRMPNNASGVAYAESKSWVCSSTGRSPLEITLWTFMHLRLSWSWKSMALNTWKLYKQVMTSVAANTWEN
jgi:hypothetical protein